MLKCINDLTKSYKGDERSPKGLGFSASAEEVGKTMYGQDSKIWYVQETKSCKKWSKINLKSLDKIEFSSLPKDFFNKAYFPKTEKINKEDETGLEEKFGGSVPFFVKGESWPINKDNDKKYVFVAQFKDPRSETNMLTRIFMDFDSNDDIDIFSKENIYLDTIELSEKNIKNQIKIDIDDDDELTIHQPYKIIKWNESSEYKEQQYFLEKFGLTDNKESVFHNFYYDNLVPNDGIKVGGTPTYTQLNTDYSIPHFLQLTECKEIPYAWGDSGIAHIYADNNIRSFGFDWDCC